MPDNTLTKVAKYEILKPEKWVGGDRDGEECSWKELGKLLRDVQYIESRIANLMLSEKYVAFRAKTTDSKKASAISRNWRLTSSSLREVLSSLISGLFIPGRDLHASMHRSTG